MMNFWDQQFSTPDYKYGTEANEFLREQAYRLAPASQVLLPGDGEGRNSVWLAHQGHQVTAVDNSAVGLDKAQKLATQHGVHLAVVLADLAQWQAEPASFDAVVLTYVHLPLSIRAQVHQRLAQALRPGGWFILEAFHPRQIGFKSGGPRQEIMLYDLAKIRADLAAIPPVPLTEVLAWEGQVLLDEGLGHQGPAFVTRYVAQRQSVSIPQTETH